MDSNNENKKVLTNMKYVHKTNSNVQWHVTENLWKEIKYKFSESIDWQKVNHLGVSLFRFGW